MGKRAMAKWRAGDYNWNQMNRNDPVDNYNRIHALNKPYTNLGKITERLENRDNDTGNTSVRSIEFEFFDVRQVVKPYRKHLFVGKSGSGKSTKAVEVMRQMRHQLEEVYVFTGSIEGKLFWQKYVPPLYIFCGYNPEKLKRIMENQTEMKDLYERGKMKRQYRILIIFEDLSFLGSLMTKDPYIMMFINQGRHLYIDGFIIAQYCKDFGPKIRGNMHYIYCTFIKERDLREKIYKEWGGLLKLQQDFDYLLEKYTQHHSVLVIDTETQSTDLKQNYYWFTVSDRQMRDLDKGFCVGNNLYRFNSELALERQKKMIQECGIPEETLRKWRLNQTIQQTIDMNKYTNRGPSKDGAGRRRKNT